MRRLSILVAFILSSAIFSYKTSAQSDPVTFSNPSESMFHYGMDYPGIFSPDSLQSTYVNEISDTSIDYGRLGLVGGTLLTSMAVIHIYQQNGWWKDNRAPFHFQEDLVYGLSVDKIGHFFGGYLMGYVVSKSVQWANVPERTAMWMGAAGGLLFQTYIEVEDGFSAWGFDRVDFASDVAGAGWAPLRYYVPFFRNFDLKMSYHPSDLLGNPGGVGFKGQKHLVIDDYEGQTFWLSVKLHAMLPESFKPYWPAFLCPAIGYGARDVGGVHPYRVYFFALDLDMTSLIPPKTPFLRTLGEALNFIHLPMPAVRFSPNAIWYGVYF